ncbi:MAG: NUDIX hydrolase [Anaerolineae bacterium]|nr:NUDIX hydrolase [Anaerolineae bacterium]
MREEYPRPMVTVDVVIFTLRENDLQVLLVRRRNPPFAGMWAIPGGFVDIDEPLETAASRELEEETGVRGVYLEQFHTFGDPGRDPRGRTITVAYLALVRADQIQPRAGDDAAEARWWSVHNLPPLAFDHDRILACARKHLRHKLECPAVIAGLLPETFTLSELQTVYEVILGEKLDRRAFRRKVLTAGVLQETGGYRRVDGRPAKLYRVRSTL